MRVWQWTLCVAFVTGRALATTPTQYLVDEGQDVPILITTLRPVYEVTACYLKTPSDARIEFIPIDESSDKYQINEPSITVGCSATIKNVTVSDNGVYTLAAEYIDGDSGTQVVDVEVTTKNGPDDEDGNENNGSENDETEPAHVSLTLVEGQYVDTEIGPENAIHCSVEDNQGELNFQGFGRVTIDRAAAEHQGKWKMAVAYSGHVLTQEQLFSVTVQDAVKPAVSTAVAVEKPQVKITCSVVTEHDVKACKFRNAHGQVLLASQAMAEGRYVASGVVTVPEGNVARQECHLTLMETVVEDLGIWRCALETENETYYGHIPVLCPWAMLNPGIAANVVAEPTLTAKTMALSVVEGDSVTMSCSVQSVITHCHFRARNGTIYSVRPGSPGWPEYAGAGFDAGECLARFIGLSVTDSGAWSCHVGLPEQPEQRANFDLAVKRALEASQTIIDGVLVIEGFVAGSMPLEYCRFVRIDGYAFTPENVGDRYESSANTFGSGYCRLRITEPTILDHHPWTIITKAIGNPREFAAVTEHSMSIPEETPEDQPMWKRTNSFTLVLMAVLLSTVLVALLLCPKKHREWAARRTTAFRQSCRNSLPTKTPLYDQNQPPTQPTLPA